MAFTPITSVSSGDPDEQPDFGKMMSLFGPRAVDQAIRQAIQTCWMMLPADKKNPDELESTIRRIVDRAIQNFREDSATFRNP